MKLLQSILFSLLMGMAVAAQAVNQEVKADLLMAKITAALKTEKAADALPAFAELESMEPSLAKPLPESFYFFYIDTLAKTEKGFDAFSRIDAYLEKYGKNGEHYGQVIEIIVKLEDGLKQVAGHCKKYKKQWDEEGKTHLCDCNRYKVWWDRVNITGLCE